MSKKSFAQRQDRYEIGWISGFFKRKKRSSQQTKDEHNTSVDSSLIMKRNKAKNLHLFLSEIMRKLKHSIRKEKPPRHAKRLLGKKKSFHKSFSTKDHYFLERMTSLSHQEQHDNNDVKHLSEMLNFGDFFSHNLATTKHVQTRIVSLPEYSSPFSSPRRIWNQSSTALSRSASDDFMKSETFTDDSITTKEIKSCSSSEGFISKTNQNVVGEKVGEILKETSYEEKLSELSLLSVASPSHYISKTEECKLVLDPLFIEIHLARGEARIQPLHIKQQENNHRMDEKESIFKYVKAILDAIDSNWEELYLRTEFSDQLLNPALISNIPFHLNQLCVDHELLFDCINEVLFEFCRFPQWVSFVKPRIQDSSLSVESIVCEVQEKVYCHLLPSKLPQSVEQIVREDMAKPRNWLDIRCDLEWIGFETSELILKELLEEFMLDLRREAVYC